MIRFCLLIVLIAGSTASAQERISNRGYFKKFFKSNAEKSLLIIGENHGSSVGPQIYPSLIEYLNKKTGMNSLLIEFGPSEAYFYTKYLKTGNEKHLNYTINAGAIEDWRIAWRKVYEYNKTLKKPLKIIGIDFDRSRTLGYALFSIFMAYDIQPAFIKPLLNEIKTDSFYNTYSMGYPLQKDVDWILKTKDILRKNLSELQKFLKSEDMDVVSEIINNKALRYGKDDGREEAITENTQRVIKNSAEQDFLLLIGRNHAYLDPLYGDKIRLANLLVDSSSIKVLTGVMLFQNSEIRSGKNQVKLYEIDNKMPWKRYSADFNKKTKNNLTVIPLRKELCPLAHFTDYIILAKNQKSSVLIK